LKISLFEERKQKNNPIWKESTMKRSLIIASVIFSALTGLVMAQSSDSHTATVVVQAIGVINVDNDLTLTVSTATPGSQPTSVSDATTSNLLWTVNGNTAKKIQVKAGAALPSGITLTVAAQNISKVGTGIPAAAGTVTLTASDQDFVTAVNKSAGTADLNYTATATVDALVQSNAITVTYTVVNG
jgi:hypothetical protein